MQTIEARPNQELPTRVLLIDDDDELTELVTEYLRREGFQADVAPDGESGVRQAMTGQYAAAVLDATPLGAALELPGPVGERNLYRTQPRGRVACVGGAGAVGRQVLAALVTGNMAVVEAVPPGLPVALRDWVLAAPDPVAGCAAVLFEGESAVLLALLDRLARQGGPIVPVLAGPTYTLDILVQEQVVSTNTTAAGGNANLMMIG